MINLIRKNVLFLLGLLMSIAVLWPLAKPGYFTHHDDVQVIRLYEMDKCIKDGQFPCRWVPDLGGGYGYPLFNYYAPMPYYIGEIFNLVSSNLLLSAKIMFGLSFLLSYVFMYLLASKLWGKAGGALSAIFYSYVPYHAVNMYVRGAMGELWAMTFFPLILYALYRLAGKVNIKNLILLSVSIGLLITSHNLSAMLFFPVIIVFTGIIYIEKKDIRFIKFSVISIILALLLTSFYWLPAAVEGKYVHLETMSMGYFSYTEHFKGLTKLFLDRTWSWGPSIREFPGSERDQMPYQIGIVHLLGLLLSFAGGIFLYKKNNKKTLLFVVSASIFFIAVSIFMIHPRSIEIWKLFDPVLKFIQFPWRFLILISFFVSFTSGGIFVIIKGKTRTFLWLMLVILVVALNWSYFRPERFISVTSNDYLTGSNWEKQIKRSIFDYLPIYAKMPPRDLIRENYQVLEGIAKVTAFSEGTDWINLEINATSPTVLRLSQYYFPGWDVTVNSNKVAIDYNNYLGLMTVNIEPGSSTVKARLHNSMVRELGNILSLLSLVYIVGILVLDKRKKKK